MYIPLIALILIFLLNLPGWSEGFFFVDDESLFNQPFLKNHDLDSLKAIFTFGNHVDFYPIRDLSIWLDWLLNKNLENNLFNAKLQNFFWFVLGGYLLFKIFKLLNLPKRLSYLTITLWFVHPMHFESLQWASARKDLMAMSLTIGAVYCLIKFYLKKSRVSLLASYFLFILGGLSKATFAFLPPVYLLYRFLFQKGNDSVLSFFKKELPLLIFSAIALLITAVQYVNYSGNNDMYMQFDWHYRLMSLLASCGRYLIGVFYFGANTVDIEPWGDFWQNNLWYIPAGILLVVTSGVGFVYALKQKHSVILLAYFLVFAILLTTPGFNYLHRNFYSMRYFEPILLLIIVSSILHFKKRDLSKILASLIAFFTLQTMADTFHWHDGLAIINKSLSRSPENLALNNNKLVLLIEKKNWGRTSPREESEMYFIFQYLRSSCLLKREYPMGCYSFLKSYYEYQNLFPLLTNQNDMSLAIHRGFELQSQMQPQMLEPAMHLMKFILSLNTENLDYPSLHFYARTMPSQGTDKKRFFKGLDICMQKGIEPAHRYLRDLYAQRLLSEQTIHEFITSVKMTEVNRDKIKECLPWL